MQVNVEKKFTPQPRAVESAPNTPDSNSLISYVSNVDPLDFHYNKFVMMT